MKYATIGEIAVLILWQARDPRPPPGPGYAYVFSYDDVERAVSTSVQPIFPARLGLSDAEDA